MPPRKRKTRKIELQLVHIYIVDDTCIIKEESKANYKMYNDAF